MEWTPRGLKLTTRPQLALQKPKMDFQMSKTDSQWPKIDSRRSKNRLLNSQIWLKEAQNRLPGSNINLQGPRIDFQRPNLYILILKARRPKIDSHTIYSIISVFYARRTGTPSHPSQGAVMHIISVLYYIRRTRSTSRVTWLFYIILYFIILYYNAPHRATPKDILQCSFQFLKI